MEDNGNKKRPETYQDVAKILGDAAETEKKELLRLLSAAQTDEDINILRAALEIFSDHKEAQFEWAKTLAIFLQKNAKNLKIRNDYKKLSDLLGNFQSGSLLPKARCKAKTWKQVIYNPVTMFQVCLPRNDKDDAIKWETRNGESTVIIKSGEKLDEQGHLVSANLPWGSFPRLVLFYINSLVNNCGDQEVFLGYSVMQFFAKLGISRQKYSYERFYEQMQRLISSGLVIGKKHPKMNIKTDHQYPFEGEGDSIEYRYFSSRIDNWTHSDINDPQRGYYIHLSQDIYDSIIDNPLPIDMEIVKQIKGNTLYLDIYALLAERLHRIPEDQTETIEWHDIADLFGKERSDKRKFFRDTFKPALKYIVSLYPDARVEMGKNSITLFPSKPPSTKLIPKVF